MTEDQEKAARDKLAKAAEARTEQAEKMAARASWRPTPTTEECDLVAMGVPIDKVGHAPSGADPDPHYERARAMWPAKGPDETTREMRPSEHPDRGYETR